jgi:hypothetical protein
MGKYNDVILKYKSNIYISIYLNFGISWIELLILSVYSLLIGKTNK